MPEWMPSVFQWLAKDAPPLVAILVMAWLLFRHLSLQHNQHLKDLHSAAERQAAQHNTHFETLKARYDAELGRNESVYATVLAAKDAEIVRLVVEKEALQKNLDSLHRQMRAEQKKP